MLRALTFWERPGTIFKWKLCLCWAAQLSIKSSCTLLPSPLPPWVDLWVAAPFLFACISFYNFTAQIRLKISVGLWWWSESFGSLWIRSRFSLLILASLHLYFYSPIYFSLSPTGPRPFPLLSAGVNQQEGPILPLLPNISIVRVKWANLLFTWAN